ncbi:MAG: hypothetical protein F4117_03665 [Acidimicrobiales bacterium]|nr:hypothetical protein [Acidimicrobiaceae bacterium]MXV86239.1 hypothetical protein [Acidimicrobiales bacterium]MCY3607879.1 hypothetical protein [Acidimicrobiaceae bacterium]MDE0676890.1 hypothetical protein [Acidimicrobiaceae bacterium]MXX42004.1 hypothetical protein [Acidimicrobiales bacterium]
MRLSDQSWTWANIETVPVTYRFDTTGLTVAGTAWTAPFFGKILDITHDRVFIDHLTALGGNSVTFTVDGTDYRFGFGGANRALGAVMANCATANL